MARQLTTVYHDISLARHRYLPAPEGVVSARRYSWASVSAGGMAIGGCEGKTRGQTLSHSALTSIIQTAHLIVGISALWVYAYLDFCIMR
jgi:hypothetical protein